MLIPLLQELKNSKLVKDFAENGVLRMDNSMCTSWACLMKGLMSHALKLRPTGKNTLAMDYGTCIHAGLEQLMLGRSIEDAQQAFLEAANEYKIDRWLDNRRCSTRGIDTINLWYLFRATLMSPIRALSCEVAGEVKRMVELGVERVIHQTERAKYVWIGRIDAVVSYKGKLWILDHKTTSMLGEKFLDDKMRSSQFLGYYYILNDYIKEKFGQPLAGVLINAICTGTKDIKFDLYELPFNQWQIDEWRRDTIELLQLIGTLLTDIYNGNITEVIPEREICVTKYGRCPFFEVCSNVPVVRYNLLKSQYEAHDWNPHDNSTILSL